MRTLLAALLLSTLAGCGAPGAAAGPTLGSVVTRDHVIVIEQTPAGLRYGIEDRAGVLVATGLTREELETIAPGAAKHLETGTALDASLTLDEPSSD